MNKFLAILLVLASCSFATAQTIDTVYVVDDGAVWNGGFTGFSDFGESWHAYGGDLYVGYGAGDSRVFSFSVTEAGGYTIYNTWAVLPSDQACQVRVTADGVEVLSTASISQNVEPAADTTQGGRPFQAVGSFNLAAGASIVVEVLKPAGGSQVVVDAIAYRRGEAEPEDPPPAAPSGLAFSGAVLSWEGPPGTTEWYVRGREVGSESWQEWSATSPVFGVAQDGLVGETWEWQVQAIMPVGSAWSSSIEYVYPDPVVAAPASLSAAALGPAAVKLLWTDTTGGGPTNETGFQVWRMAGEETTYSLVHTTSAGATTWTDIDVSGGILYKYKVRGVRASPEAYSSFIGPASVTTPTLDGFGSGSPDGQTRSHVSGDVTYFDEHIRVLQSQMFYIAAVGQSWFLSPFEEPSSVAGETLINRVGRGLKTCGTRSFSFSCFYVLEKDVIEHGLDEENLMASGYCRLASFKITVGRNGSIEIDLVGGYLPEADEFNFTGEAVNIPISFQPAMLKHLLENEAGIFGRSSSEEGYDKAGYLEDGIAVGKLRDYCNAWKSFGQQIYSSITGGSVDWPSVIPRCPGEDLDGFGPGASGSGSSTGSYSGTHSAPNTTHSGSVATASELSRLLPGNLELNAEASPIVAFQMSEVMGGQGNMLGFSAGNMWVVDLKDLGGFYEPLSTAMNDRRLWIRGALLVGVSLFYLGKFRALLS